MSACARSPSPALIRVSTLLKLLANRARTGAESDSTLQLQARAELALQELAETLGELDERPVQAAIEDQRFAS
jgi:hypothetical protein